MEKFKLSDELIKSGLKDRVLEGWINPTTEFLSDDIDPINTTIFEVKRSFISYKGLTDGIDTLANYLNKKRHLFSLKYLRSKKRYNFLVNELKQLDQLTLEVDNILQKNKINPTNINYYVKYEFIVNGWDAHLDVYDCRIFYKTDREQREIGRFSKDDETGRYFFDYKIMEWKKLS